MLDGNNELAGHTDNFSNQDAVLVSKRQRRAQIHQLIEHCFGVRNLRLIREVVPVLIIAGKCNRRGCPKPLDVEPTHTALF